MTSCQDPALLNQSSLRWPSAQMEHIMARGLMARLEPLTEPERWTAWIGSEVGHRRLTARELGCSGEFRVEPVVGDWQQTARAFCG